MRGHTAPTNELGNYSYYCRACGFVMQQAEMPIICVWCGNSLPDTGFGISGEAGRVETSLTTYPNRGHFITNIDKPVR